MKLAISYLTVTIVWATTPIAVKFSSMELGFIPGVAVRVLVAAVIVYAVLKVMGKRLVEHKRDWLAFSSGALALFPTMLLVYFSALYLDSGLISVLFGLSPFFVGIFSMMIFGDNPFSRARVLALCISLFGLVLINSSQMGMGDEALKGFLCMLLAVAMFALSSVALKATATGIEPIRQLSGTLIVAAPFFAIAMMFSDGLPKHASIFALAAIAYLIVFGSIVAGVAYVFILSRCDVITVSLIPLITPVFAIVLGFVLAGEKMSIVALLGSVMILFSLAIYQGFFSMLMGRLKVRGA